MTDFRCLADRKLGCRRACTGASEHTTEILLLLRSKESTAHTTTTLTTRAEGGLLNYSIYLAFPSVQLEFNEPDPFFQGFEL